MHSLLAAACAPLLGVLAASAVLPPTVNVTPQERRNLLENASFEEGDSEGQPLHWQTRGWSGEPEFTVDSEVARTGGRSVKVSSRDGADASWSTRSWR